MIRAGVGLSSDPATESAVLAAAERAVEGLDGDRADWCLAFVTPEHAGNIPVIVDTILDATGTPYVAGCSAAGVLAEGRELEEGPAIGVLAVASGAIRATPFLFPDEGDHGLTVGARLGQRLISSAGTDDLVLVWPDPFHVRPDRLLRGLHSALGGVPVAGCAAAGRGTGGTTFQFCGADESSGAVSGVRLGGAFRHRVGITQGCRPVGSPMQVTRSHENLILEIEGRPALTTLREAIPQDLLEQGDSGLQYVCVGLLPDSREAPARPGEYVVRNLVSADDDTGVLAVNDDVEEGQRVVFVVRDASTAREDMTRMLAEIVSERPLPDFRLGLYFNCLARGRSLYRASGVDASFLREALPGVPVLGLFCNAEIAPLCGANQLFTCTGVLVLIAA